MWLKTKLVVTILVFIGSVSLYPMGRIIIQNDRDAIRAMGAQMSHMRHLLEIYSLIGSGVSYKNPKKRLEVMIWDYEKTIEVIKKRYKNDKFIQNSLKKAQKAWIPLKKEFEEVLGDDKPHQEMIRKDAIFIHNNIRDVIKEMEAIKNHLVKISKNRDNEILNAAIEVSASARRLSSHYMMKMWRLPDPTIEKHWDRGAEIFKKSLETLEKSKFMKNPEFAKELAKAKKAYKYILTIYSFKGKYMPVAIQDKANIAYKAGMNMVKIILNDTKK